jgi:hypothetical protein
MSTALPWNDSYRICPKTALRLPVGPTDKAGFTESLYEAFAKLKTLLRKANARGFEAIEATIAGLLKALTPSERCNFVSQTGYAATQKYHALVSRT